MSENKEYTRLVINVGVLRKALRIANANYSDLQPVNGVMSAAGLDAIAVTMAFSLSAGENISYEEAQEYIDNMHPADERYQSLIKRTAELLKKNLNP